MITLHQIQAMLDDLSDHLGNLSKSDWDAWGKELNDTIVAAAGKLPETEEGA